MAIWIFNKAYKCEMKNARAKPVRPQKYCRICSTPIHSGAFCKSCGAFIKQKQNEERTGRNGNREP